MDRNVFISYKSEDYSTAKWLKNKLEANGIGCWVAPDCIPGGSNYGREIPRAIKNCKVFIVLISKKAQKSQWVSKELNQALVENKVIMPYMIDDCVLQEEFNFYLGDVQRYDAFDNKSEAADRMIDEICSVLEKTRVEGPHKKEINIKRILLIALACLLFPPLGIPAAVTHILECLKIGKQEIMNKATKVLYIAGIVVGCFFWVGVFSS